MVISQTGKKSSKLISFPYLILEQVLGG